MSTFVSVGNSRYQMQRLLRVVCKYSEQLPQPIHVQNGHTPFVCPSVRSSAFVSQSQFEQYLIKADVIVLHGGGGSILQANRFGKVPVVMPRRVGREEHIDDHQHALCRRLAQMGKVILLEEPDKLIEAVSQAIAFPQLRRAQSKHGQMFELVDAALRAATNNKR
ncbi:MAG: glycosyltransferase [Pseudomonadota bacterium]